MKNIDTKVFVLAFSPATLCCCTGHLKFDMKKSHVIVHTVFMTGDNLGYEANLEVIL